MEDKNETIKKHFFFIYLHRGKNGDVKSSIFAIMGVKSETKPHKKGWSHEPAFSNQ